MAVIAVGIAVYGFTEDVLRHGECPDRGRGKGAWEGKKYPLKRQISTGIFMMKI